MRNKPALAIFSFSHLVVDFACFYVLMGVFSSGAGSSQLVVAGFLLYNLIAFALQVFFGIVADGGKSAHGYYAFLGCIVVLLGVSIQASPWIHLVTCAFGNALFHVGGGIDSLVHAGGRYARSGVFISFGALGVMLGTLVGRGALLPFGAVSLLLIICSALIYIFCRQPKAHNEAIFSLPPARVSLPAMVIGLCLISIIIRASVGAYTPLFERGTTLRFVIPAVSVFAGKFMGGFLADRFGARLVVVISLLVSAPLLAFGNTQVVLCCTGLFLFNITTAVTLCVVFSHLPAHPGFSFGLTTLALFIGSSFSFFWLMPEGIRPFLTVTLVAASVVCLALATPGKSTRHTVAAVAENGTNTRFSL